MRVPRSILLPAIAGVALMSAAIHVARTHEVPPVLSPPVSPSRAPYRDTIAGAGLVESSSENIRVGTLLPGVVTEVAVVVGQRVRKGDVLFRLDDRERRAELAVRRAQLLLAEAQLARQRELPRAEDVPVSEANVAKAQADLLGRRDLLERTEVLLSRNVSTQEELTQRQQAVAWAKAELTRSQAEDARLKAGAWKQDITVAEAQAAAAREQMTQVEIDLERLVVRTVMDGTVLKVDVRPGEYVGTPPNQTLILLGNIDTLHVRVDIDEYDLPRFRPGLPGTGYVRGDVDTPLALEFVRLERFAEPKRSLTGAGNERVDTRVLQVIYRIVSTDRPVYVGQQIDAYLDAGSR